LLAAKLAIVSGHPASPSAARDGCASALELLTLAQRDAAELAAQLDALTAAA
jgi:hypothetical protein